MASDQLLFIFPLVHSQSPTPAIVTVKIIHSFIKLSSAQQKRNQQQPQNFSLTDVQLTIHTHSRAELKILRLPNAGEQYSIWSWCIDFAIIYYHHQQHVAQSFYIYSCINYTVSIDTQLWYMDVECNVQQLKVDRKRCMTTCWSCCELHCCRFCSLFFSLRS